MRKYEDKEKEVVVASECVEVICDMCGRKAEFPSISKRPFEWGAVGQGGGSLHAEYAIDGELSVTSLDLCYECAEWLVEQVRTRKVVRGFKQ